MIDNWLIVLFCMFKKRKKKIKEHFKFDINHSSFYILQKDTQFTIELLAD